MVYFFREELIWTLSQPNDPFICITLRFKTHLFLQRWSVLVKMRACGSVGWFTQQGFDFYWDKAVHAPNWWEERELWRFALWTLGFDVCAISSVWGATVTVSEDSNNRVCLSFWLSALCISSTSHFMSLFLFLPSHSDMRVKIWNPKMGKKRWRSSDWNDCYQWSLFELSANWTP